jgi:predicted nuclease with TOPRIM domain
MNLKPQNGGGDQDPSPIIFYLPSELSKEDILDAGGMQIRYDDKRSALFLFGEAKPGSEVVKSYKVIVRDVWRIPQTDLDFIKTQIKGRVQYLEGTDDLAAGQKLADHILKELDGIEKAQSEEMTIPDRIEMHRMAAEKIDQIRGQVTVMADYVKQARWFKEVSETTETVKMTIQIKNPLSEKLDREKVVRYLPRGVTPNDVIDAQGFTVKYDPERQMFFLYKEVDLKPSEAMTAVVTFKNAWKVPIEKLELLVKSAEDLQTRLVGSQYEETGKKIFDELNKLATQIKELQAKSESPADMIANFSLNLTRFNAIEDGERKLKELVHEIEHPVPQSIPYYIKPATPDVSTTWKIIYGFIGFLTVLGLMFYALWWGQSKARISRKYEPHKA